MRQGSIPRMKTSAKTSSMTEPKANKGIATEPGKKRSRGTLPLTPEARRALDEAEARRRKARKNAGKQPAEKGGQDGPDPVRYGDWEKDGIVSDF